MNPTLLARITFWILIVFGFQYCKKDKCDDPSHNTIETNSPVVVGWGLHLKASYVAGGRYVWTGPNGWSVDNQASISTDDYLEEVTPVSVQSAGEYKVQVYNYEGCLVSEGTTTVEVIPPPPPPCAVTPNRSESSVIGVGSYNFQFRYFSVGASYFIVSGSPSAVGGTDFMRFGFWGQTRPKPGVYTITDGYFGDEYGTVGLFIQSGGYQFLAQGGKVYVTATSNGKLSVSFCNIVFSNPLNPSPPITVSGNITEP